MSNKVRRQSRQISKTDDNQIIAQSVSIERSGFLPAPEDLEQYEKLYPGMTKILMDEFQKQTSHRIKMESMVVTSGIQNMQRGQIFAFIIALVVIFGGFALVFVGKNIFGLAAILGALATLIGVFIYGNISKRKERLQKYNDVQ